MSAPWLRQELPPLKIPLAYFLGAALGLVGVCVGLALSLREIEPGFFQPRLLFLAHFFVAAFLLPVLFGVWHQLIPTLFTRRIPGSPRLHLAGFTALLLGGIGLASHMALGKWDRGLWSSAVMFYLALLFHLGLFARALLQVKRSDASVRAFLAALVSLAVAGLLGVLMAFNLASPFFTQSHLQWLRVHMLFAFAGAVFFPLFGAMPRLFPMFLLTRNVGDGVLRLGMFSLWSGLWLSFLGMIWPGGTWISWTLILLGLLTLPLQAVRYGKAALRPLRGSAVGLAGAGILQLPVCLLLIPLFNRGVLVHGGLTLGLAAMLGFTSLLILGVLLKILPFLIWLHRFGDDPGSPEVPAVEDLIPSRAVRFSEFLILAGYFALLFGLVLKGEFLLTSAAWILTFGCAVYAGCLWSMAWPALFPKRGGNPCLTTP